LSQLLTWLASNNFTPSQGQLKLALTHRSFSTDNNERLEYLGDAVLDLVIGEQLYIQLPKAKEGQLSRLRAQLVEGKMLAAIAKEQGLAELIRLGKGEEKTGGRERASILAGCFEAVIGAVYLEKGFIVCQELILQLYQARLCNIDTLLEQRDPKTALQEFLQKQGLSLPSYSIDKTEGPQHRQRFFVSCRVPDTQYHVAAEAGSKKMAESKAAEKMLALLADE
jgi:ribonuclease-3